MTLALCDFPIERMRADDPFRDFCLWDYVPPRPPAADAISGVNLLYAAAAISDSAHDYRDLAVTLRRSVGSFRTVWGVKWNSGIASAEFYFYDYARTDRAVPFKHIAAAFAPVANVTICPSEALPYFMASIEVPLAVPAQPPEVRNIDIYVGNPDESGISSGLCYEVAEDAIEFKNLYYFFDARSDWDSVLAKAACSAHVPLGSVRAEAVFPNWLREARVVVVANKRRTDGAYFSGISVDALIRFMEQFAYPDELVSFARENRDRLAHLLFDVGYDYRVENGRVVFGKSSIYNVL